MPPVEGSRIASPHTIRTTLRTSTLALTLVALVVSLVPTPAFADARTRRVAGADRYATAADLALATFGDTEYALLARGDRFPDALAAAPLAGHLQAPVLLTHRDDVPDVTMDTLGQLGVRGAILLGGQAAVGESAAHELEEAGYAVDRIAGHDRYHTAIDIAERVGPSDTAWLASGVSFPDALAAGPPTFEHRIPMLLTPPDRLPPDVEAAVGDLGAQRVVIVGGPAAVSVDVERDLEEGGVEVLRLAGRDRADTAVQIAEYAEGSLGFDSGEVLLARGDAFPDALAAAPYAASLDGPILLTRDPHTNDYDTLQYAVDHAPEIEVVIGLGGPQALADRVIQRVAEAAKQPVDTYTYAVGVQDDEGEVDADVGYFAEHVDWTLTDQRGWALDNDYRFTQVAQDQPHDFTVWLASPQDVDEAAPGCSARWSCTVGADIYINVERWNQATETYDQRPLDDYRHYVVLHEAGHWIGLDHIECADSPSDEAPVMQQQSISLDGCSTNVWPLQFERDRARDHLRSGDTQGQMTTEE